MPFHKYSYTNGYRAPAPDSPVTEETSGEKPSYPTSLKPNEKGILKDATFPSLLAGTSAPGVLPSWFKKDSEVDVVICGAGPSGLEVAVSLLRQGVSFRIVGRGSAVTQSSYRTYPETIATLGLATEVAEEGPLIERTAIWKDGRCLHWGHSHQSDSRYRGLHIITQTAIEHIYIRDLLRHKKLVERRTTVKSFTVDESGDNSHPVSITLINEDTGEQEVVRAKHLVGSDGGNSTIRKQAGIPFEGETTTFTGVSSMPSSKPTTPMPTYSGELMSYIFSPTNAVRKFRYELGTRR
ncbi:YUC protein [Salix suchowensis]|nr:YUC protein [Salix suchowensis]